MVFLGLHEQQALGFSSTTQLQRLSSINLIKQGSLPEILVPESKIQFFNDEPKTTYTLVLRYHPFKSTQ
jgi:hypothetical protein